MKTFRFYLKHKWELSWLKHLWLEATLIFIRNKRQQQLCQRAVTEDYWWSNKLSLLLVSRVGTHSGMCGGAGGVWTRPWTPWGGELRLFVFLWCKQLSVIIVILFIVSSCWERINERRQELQPCCIPGDVHTVYSYRDIWQDVLMSFFLIAS